MTYSEDPALSFGCDKDAGEMDWCDDSGRKEFAIAKADSAKLVAKSRLSIQRLFLLDTLTGRPEASTGLLLYGKLGVFAF